MATKVGSDRPADAQWQWINPNNLDIQKSGEWAVKEQNRRHPSDQLTLNTIDQSWVIPLAPGSGNLYLLHLHALKETEMFKYQAFVWAKPADCVTADCPDRNTLVSFQEAGARSA